MKRTIKKLEQKPNKTPEEEVELEKLKNKLKDLENNNSSPFNYIPWLIGGGCVLVFLVVIGYCFFKKSKKSYE